MNFNLTLIAQALVFVAFFMFCARFVWPPLLRAIESRQKQIADGLAEAERGRASLSEAQKQTEVLMRDARARAQEIIASAEKVAAQRVEDSKSVAKTEAERMISAAKASIEQEVQSARQQLREQVAVLAVSGAEKILRREVDAKAHAEMLGQLKAQL
ncbi:MAG TPA: F0F1 ATP synthase subunit B [Usitatibacter sp.]|nr:F0F1 ATP synthase subunit B [Usitatibacter sp.]